MYRIRFAFRDGNDAVFVSESYYRSRLFLRANGTISDGELLYAEISYCRRDISYTMDLIDWRFRCDGIVMSLGDHISIQSAEDPSELLTGCIDEIDPVIGQILVSVFDHDDYNGWFGIERLI